MADSLFGLSEKALTLCEERATMLSGNVVNSATPNYKARDIDFYNILQNESAQTMNMAATTAGHIPIESDVSGVKYRVPMQSSVDGNTVDEEIERKNFLQNAMNYQVNLTFIKNTSDQILKAIKGA